MKTLTVFTPTYNRAHTLPRTYESLCRQTCNDFTWLIIDDGSSDNTQAWVTSLGTGKWIEDFVYDWMGRVTTDKSQSIHYKTEVQTSKTTIHIDYIYKPNGGLYSGYNVAYNAIDTELCVCVDSDDYLPDNAVEIITNKWGKLSDEEKLQYCGILGLDFNVVDKLPIGGFFKEKETSVNQFELDHIGDTKQVMRTALMKTVSPMTGFEGERDFNPFYMLSQILDKYPILLYNDNLCWVEYQVGADSMSQNIFNQYLRSPRSYAKYRINEMKLSHVRGIKRYKACAHYISSCILSKDKNWFKNTPYKLLTIMAIPLGIIFVGYIKYKTKK